MSNVVADLLPLSAVAILSFIAWLDVQVLQVDTRTALADAAPYMIGWFSFLFISPARRFATVRSFVHTFTLLLAALLLNWQFNLHAEVGLRQLYRDLFPKIDAKLAEIVADHHFSLMDESGCCGFHYNLTLDLQNLTAVVEKAREKWWRCSAG